MSGRESVGDVSQYERSISEMMQQQNVSCCPHSRHPLCHAALVCWQNSKYLQQIVCKVFIHCYLLRNVVVAVVFS